MLLTTCTTCAAQFKVLPEHLNVRQGRVMCGRCRTVFNAFETLKRVEDELPVMPTSYFPTSVAASANASASTLSSAYAQTMSPTGAAPSYNVAGGEVSAPVTNTGFRDDSTGRFTPLLDSMLSEPVVVERDSPPTMRGPFSTPVAPPPEIADEFKALVQATSVLDQTTETVATPLRREPTIGADDLRDLSFAAALDPLLETKLESPLEFSSAPLSGPSLMATDPPENTEIDMDVDTDTFSYPREPAPQPPATRRWLYLCGVAILVLCVQAVFYFRHSLAQAYPQLRPTLASACEMVGCRLSWAREAAAIEVKGSELVELPSKPGRMLASATLINRGKLTQDYPSIELRLTNNTNQTVMSRILLPSDYLNRAGLNASGNEAASIDQGLLPNAELALSLNIEVPPKTAASGYEFIPFYP